MFFNSNSQYGLITKILHWLLCILIIVQATGGLLFDEMSKALRSTIMPYHKSLGLLILLIVVLMILLRLFTPKPAWPVSMPKWERFAAKAGHAVLYLCLLIMPLSGWLMSTAAGWPPYFFGLGPIPMPGIPLDKALAGIASNVHSVVIWVLIVIAAIHIIAALRHHFFEKDNVLKNMWF